MGDVIYQNAATAARVPPSVRSSVADARAVHDEAPARQDPRAAYHARAAGWPMFRAAAQLETVHWLIQALGALEPFVAVTGDPEIGKSVVAAEAAAQLEARGYLMILATPPFAGPLELQALLAEGLGLPAGLQTAPAAIAATLHRRSTAAEPAKPVVLLIDGAEALPRSILQYLWLMHRLCWSGRPALQMVFVGRFAFWDHVMAPDLSDLHTAIVARAMVLSLTAEEALGYLQHRLVLAGAAEAPGIPPRLAPAILALGQGIPGRINVISDMIVACEPSRLRVTRQGVRAAAAMLSGDAALARAPTASRRNAPALVAGAVAAAALAIGWLLLARPDAWTPDRSAPPTRHVLATAPAAMPPAPAAAATYPQPPEPSAPAPSAPEPAPTALLAPTSAAVPAPVPDATTLPSSVPAPAAAPAPVPVLAPAPESVAAAAPVPAAVAAAVSASVPGATTLPSSVPAPAAAPAPVPVLAPASESVAAAAPVPAPVAAAISAPVPTPTPLPLPTLAPAPASLPTRSVVAAVAKAVTVAPPIVVLPDAAMLRITVQYAQADPGAAAHARSVVSILRARGLSVGDPAPIAGIARPTEVEYYFAEDRGEAEQLARELGGAVNAGHIDERNPNLPPPPGTLRVVLSGRAVSTVAPIAAATPTSASAD